MAEFREGASDELILCLALRHFGDVRELLILKVKENNYYAFPTYAKKPEGRVDAHNSWHASGEFHVTFKIDGRQVRRKHEMFPIPWTESRVPPAELKGVGQLFHSSLPTFQFAELPPVGTNEGDSVELDAQGANFRNDAIFVRVYLVEPGAEDRIPIFPCIGARILHLDKRTTPWLAVELFQQAENIDWGGATERLREWERQMLLCSGKSVA